MTELDPLIKAFIKTLKEANITDTDTNTPSTPSLTSTQFECFTPECRRTVVDSFDIEPGTVVVVDTWEAMRIVEDNDNDAWIGYDGRTYTHERFAQIARSSTGVVRIAHYGII